MVVTGIAVWSGPMLLTAMCGVYYPQAIGAAGWAITIYALCTVLKNKTHAPKFTKPDFNNLLVYVGFLIALAVYAGFPTESIEGGRDMGVYANHGIYISQSSRLDVPYPWLGTNDFLYNSFQQLPGFYKTSPTMTAQFSHLFPVWLAQTYSSFGPAGLFRLNAFFSILSITIFYGICRLIVPTSFATAAALFLAFNASQIWIARITLTEVLTQLFIWSGLLLIAEALRNEDRSLARLAGVFFGLSAFVRIDSLLLIPLLFYAQWFFKIFTAENNPSQIWKPLHQASLPVFVLAVCYYRFYSTPYFYDLLPQITKIGIASGIALLTLLLTTNRLALFLRTVFYNRILWITVGVFIFAFASYAYWLRPNLDHFSLIDWPGNPLNGTRDYREDSLVNLARYLSPLVVWSAISGWFLMFWQVGRHRLNFIFLPALIVAGGFTVIYLWNPSITPYHFWAIRRFIPVAIPAIIFFATFALYTVANMVSKPLSVLLSLSILLSLALFTYGSNTSLLNFSENKGFYSQVSDLAKHIPENTLIFSNDGTSSAQIETPLFLSFRRKIFPLDLNSRDGVNNISLYLKQCGSFYLLNEGSQLPKGLNGTKIYSKKITRSYLQQEFHPLPTKVRMEEKSITLYRITGIDTNFLNINLGAEHHFGTFEEGFYIQEVGAHGPLRWTNGNAKLVIPIVTGSKPNFLRISLESNGTNLTISANKEILFTGHITAGAWSKLIPLPNMISEKEVVVKIQSGTFTPQKTKNDSSDIRTLGVSIHEIKLLTKIPDYNDTLLGAQTIAGIEESGFYGQDEPNKEPARWTNGNARITVPVEIVPKALQVELISTGPKGTILKILVNKKILFHEQLPVGPWAKLFPLSKIPIRKDVVVEIQCTPFIPQESIKGSTDNRPLGVLLRDIKLLSKAPDYTNIVLGSQQIAGIEESGFHLQEIYNGAPGRWTNGIAKLAVPLDEGSKPKKLRLDLKAVGPKGATVQVILNGQKLSRDKIVSGPWSGTFNIAHIELGTVANIEIRSDTFTPSKDGINQDSRKLGAFVSGIKLICQ